MPGTSNISAEDLPYEQLYWGACLIDEGKIGFVVFFLSEVVEAVVFPSSIRQVP